MGASRRAQSNLSVAFLVTESLAAVVCGCVSDLLQQHVSLASLLAATSAVGAWSYLVVATTDALMVGTVGVGFSMGAAWCMFPQLAAERFGLRRFGTAWGALMMGSGVGPLLLQPVQAAVYAANVPQSPLRVGADQHLCRLPACFVTTLLCAAALATASVVVLVVVGRRLRLPKQAA